MGARTRGLARHVAITMIVAGGGACEVAHQIGEAPGDVTAFGSATATSEFSTDGGTTIAVSTDATTSTQDSGSDATVGEVSTITDTDTSGSSDVSTSIGTAGSDEATTSDGGSSDDGTTSVGGSDGGSSSTGTAG